MVKLNVPAWRLSVLGQCQLCAPSGKPVGFSTRKALALLAYLAFQSGRKASRERLAAVFWPDGDSEQARLNLRKALSLIRQAQSAGGTPLVSTAGDLVGIPEGVLVTDVDELDRVLGASPAEALSAYAGPFLQDFSIRGAPEFDDWVTLQGDALHQRVIERVGQALDEALAGGAPPEAVAETAQRLLALDPLNERTHRVVMRAQIRQGRRAAAVRHLNELEVRLRRELGVDPDAETRKVLSEVEPLSGEARSGEASGPSAAEGPQPARTGGRRRPRMWLAAATLLVGGAVWAAWASRPAGPPELGELRSLASVRFDYFQPDLSPKGDFVAFSSRRRVPGNADIYIQSVAGASPVRITADPAVDENPAWRPDGGAVAFTRVETAEGAPCRVIVVGVPRGRERTVGPCPGGVPSRLAWSADGRSLYLGGRAGVGRPRSLFRMDVASGEAVRITTPPEGYWGDDEPVVSPDGRHVAFMRRVTWTSVGVFVLRTDTGEVRPLSEERARLWGLAWAPDGQGVFFSSNRRGDTGLWWLPLKGGEEPRRLAGGFQDVHAVSTARGANYLVFEALYNLSDLRIGRLGADRTGVPGLPPPQPGKSDWFPAVAGDGALAFVSDRSGSEQLWLFADGALRRLTDLSGITSQNPRWSPDGRQIAFVAARDGRSNLYVVGRDGGPMRVLSSGAVEEGSPAWSADGRHVHFASRRSGAWRIWRTAADGTTPAEPVTGDGPRAVRLGPDGRSLYVVMDGRAGIWRADFTQGRVTGSWSLVEPTLASDDWMNWDVVGGALYYNRRSTDGSSGEVRRRDLASGADGPAPGGGDVPMLASFAATPDGRLILTYRSGEMHLMGSDLRGLGRGRR